ncbi:MAG: PAS domain S-box protein [Clostridia bacterium]|nr:PAS domain S-box protein [Clostridia bacterium]
MLTNVATLVALIISAIICIIFISIIKHKISRSQLKTAFIFLYSSMLVIYMGTILQIIFSNILKINPIYFEYFIYIGNVLLPLGFLFMGLIFANTKIKFKNRYLVLVLIQIISLIVLWTNDYHHLFYKQYSIYPTEAVVGVYGNVYNIYSILLFTVGIVYLLVYSIKNSGFFSKQAILMILGATVPIGVNFLTSFKIINTTIYITPISFTISILIFTLAIFKFKFLRVTPVALQKIVDRISDSYIVINEDNVITDFNKTLLTTLKIKDENVRNKNIFQFMSKYKIDIEKIQKALIKVKNFNETERFEIKIEKANKYFTVEINTIRQKEQFLGVLILFKDITQHKEDMETIRRNQDILVERERLASLGQMIGGIAHNLKTPIMSVSGATEGLNELIREYDLSIDNPQVNSEDHHEIVKDMDEWIKKIRNYIEYMSDIITAVKGQAVNFVDEEQEDFTVAELVKHVTILMRHELKNAIIYLNSQINCNDNIEIKGNINSLVQVINNIISNAIQAYKGEPDKNIDMIISTEGNNIVITIRDYGPGLPEEVQEKLFKEMVTTKGKNGTGLGLYMSYSNIRAHFSGDITVKTKAGKGTEFNIIIPVKR